MFIQHLSRVFVFRILLFVSFLPLFTILIYNLTIGPTPYPLNIGIVNKEIPSHCSYKTFDTCDENIPISCKYMHEMEKQNLILVSNSSIYSNDGFMFTIIDFIY